MEGEPMNYARKLLVVGLIVVIGGCAGASTPSAPPSANVTGKWAGTWSFRNPAMGGGQVSMDLKQDGAKVTGPMSVTGPTSSEPTNFQGTMSGNTITLDAAHGSGTLTVKGDEMTGMVYGIMPATVSLKRQR
jgi:hypothetical protein